MSISHGQLTATTTPQLLFKAEADGNSITIHNDDAGSATAYLGSSASVTASNGFHLAAKETMPSFVICPLAEVWVVTAAGTVEVSFFACN